MEEEGEEIWGNFDKHLENFSNYLHIYLKVWIGKCSEVELISSIEDGIKL